VDPASLEEGRSAWWSDRGPRLSSKTSWRLAGRSVALVLLFCGGLVWQLAVPASPAPLSAPEVAQASTPPSLSSVSSSSSSSPARALAATVGCNEALAEPPANYSVSLLFVDKSQLVTHAEDPDTCTVSNGVCLKSSHVGWIVLYILGILYMFLALAIVCDEFFVPSLEVFCDKFDISPDIAGATFMAAGGSMPELFTSFIGTFQSPPSDVGFATIVGSAVFNVLFVIAVCAVSSKEVLSLTWWPLARDCAYYVLGLCVLALFFKGITPGRIDLGEALILLAMYVGYCVFMKFNETIYMKVESLRGVKVQPAGQADGTDEDNKQKKNAHWLKPSTFRTGIIKLLVQNEDIVETAGIAAVSSVVGDLDETFRKIDKDNSGYIDQEELKDLLELLHCRTNSKNIKTAMQSINRTGKGQIRKEDFKKWYLGSEARVEIKMRRVFEKFDNNSNGTIEREEVFKILTSLGHKPTKADVTAAIKEMLSVNDEGDSVAPVDGLSPRPPHVATEAVVETPVDDVLEGEVEHRPSRSAVHISFKEFETWYSTSLFHKQAQKANENEQHDFENQGFSIDFPENPKASALVGYFITYPLCAAMYCTMPDVRRKGNDKVHLAILEFFLSLCWIAVFAMCLVDWVTVTSNTVGIPTPVAGITVLAAGTSIPDLLSSYIVARQGKGDMAVSSSIGSNIFDILVGLPLPWLCFNLIKGESVEVATGGLFLSIVLLIVMLVSVIAAVVVMNWRMTKSLGYVMFALYFVFIIQSLVRDLPEGDALWKIDF